MKGINQTLIKQVLNKLAELYREEQVTLAQQLIWMKLLLERTDTVPQEEKQSIRENLNMYESLWDDNPKVKQIKAKAEAEGLKIGLEQGLEQGKAQSIVQRPLEDCEKAFS